MFQFLPKVFDGIIFRALCRSGARFRVSVNFKLRIDGICCNNETFSCTKSQNTAIAEPKFESNSIHSDLTVSSAHTGSKGDLTLGGPMFTNKSRDVQAFPMLFCPPDSSLVSVTSFPPPHPSLCQWVVMGNPG